MIVNTLGRRMLAAGALAAAAIGASAATAHANPLRIAGSEDVTIPGKNFDFGSAVLSGGDPDGPGTLRWLMADGHAQPNLEGYIDIKKANGSCAYVQILSIDKNENVLHTENSPEFCASGNKLQSFYVRFGSYSSPFVVKATVQLIKVQGVGSSVVGSHTVDLGPFPKDAEIDEQGWEIRDEPGGFRLVRKQ